MVMPVFYQAVQTRRALKTTFILILKHFWFKYAKCDQKWCIITELSLQLKNKSLHSSGSIQPDVCMVQTFHAVSLSCDINTGKNQSDCTNCLNCLRITNKAPYMYVNYRLVLKQLAMSKIEAFNTYLLLFSQIGHNPRHSVKCNNISENAINNH